MPQAHDAKTLYAFRPMPLSNRTKKGGPPGRAEHGQPRQKPIVHAHNQPLSIIFSQCPCSWLLYRHPLVPPPTQEASLSPMCHNVAASLAYKPNKIVCYLHLSLLVHKFRSGCCHRLHVSATCNMAPCRSPALHLPLRSKPPHTPAQGWTASSAAQTRCSQTYLIFNLVFFSRALPTFPARQNPPPPTVARPPS